MNIPIEFTAGIIAGWSQILAGQPFDILKVRLQTNIGQFTGMADCLKQIIRNEGVFALYKGSSFPLLLTGTSSAFSFGIYEKMKKCIGDNSFQSLYISGMISGIFGSFLTGPMEHIRIRVQSLNSKYKNSNDALFKIYKKHGIRGIYKGQTPTMAREQFLGLYFGIYTLGMEKTKDVYGNKQWYSTIVSSITSGFFYWTFNYPFDTIKTKMQSDGFQRPKYRNMLDCANKVIKKQGVKGLYAGFLPCQARSAPVSVVVFSTYEKVISSLQKNNL